MRIGIFLVAYVRSIQKNVINYVNVNSGGNGGCYFANSIAPLQYKIIMDNDIKIYVVGTHNDRWNDFLLRKSPEREKFFVEMEHTGDNIDYLNKWYCEQTALYYLLKNTTEPIIGLEHYRTQIYEDDSMLGPNNATLMSADTIHKLLEEYDVIAGIWNYENRKDGVSLKKNLNGWLKGELKLLYDAIKTVHPEFMSYVEEFVKPLGGYHIACNVFISKRETIQEYWDYMWPIMQEYERVSPLNSNNLRREGYVYEFLFGAWIKMKRLRLRKAKVLKRKKDFSALQGKTEI